MTRRLGFRKSLRDTLIENNRATEFYAAMAGKPAVNLAPIAPKRERKESRDIDAVHRQQPLPLEIDIQRAIMDALKRHPKVSFVGRFNRGSAIRTDAKGRGYYTRFNSVPGFPDLHGMLKGGAAWYIEVKRPGGVTTDEQADFLAGIQRDGGLAGIATNVDEALAILKLTD